MEKAAAMALRDAHGSDGTASAYCFGFNYNDAIGIP
jgi:hypothetical protein